MARLDLMAAINAAAAEMQNATVNENQSAQSAEPVRPKVSPSGAKPKVKPAGKAETPPKAAPTIDPAEAIKAAAAKVEGRPTPDPSRNGGERAGAKGRPTPDPSRNGGEKAGAKKADSKTDTPKTKATGKAADTKAEKKPIDIKNLQCKYAIPDDFKMAIRLYMEGRAKTDAIVKQKMAAAGKSLEGCCEYIYGVMMRRALQQLTKRENTGVGLNPSPEEVYGLAMHYYDETDEALKAELNGKEG